MTLRPLDDATEVVTLVDAKRHLKVDFDEDNEYITSLIQAASVWINTWLGLSLGSRQWSLTLDKFPESRLYLPVPALSSVESVEYTDVDGVSQSYAAFRVFGLDAKDPGYILPAVGDPWPLISTEPESVIVEFTAGAAEIPASIRHAVLLLVGGWYWNRESVSDKPVGAVPFGVDALLLPHRNWSTG
jgi:uncharacterized phiE125 gp8 family phage protein